MKLFRKLFVDHSGLLTLLLVVSTGLVRSTATAAVLPPVSGEQDFLLSNWETEDGLPQSSATSIAQTPDGFLWVGTFEGLAEAGLKLKPNTAQNLFFETPTSVAGFYF